MAQALRVVNTCGPEHGVEMRPQIRYKFRFRQQATTMASRSPLPVPLVDARDREQLRAELLRLAGEYARDWSSRDAGPGLAFVELIAFQNGIAIERLNAFAGKAFLETLNLVGLSLRPRIAATAMVHLRPVAGIPPEGSWVPRGTPIATEEEDPEGGPIVFETARAVRVSNRKLIGAYSRVGHSWADHSQALAAGESFVLFENLQPVRSRLFISDERLSLLLDEGQLDVFIEFTDLEDPLPLAERMLWEFWDGRAWIEVGAETLPPQAGALGVRQGFRLRGPLPVAEDVQFPLLFQCNHEGMWLKLKLDRPLRDAELAFGNAASVMLRVEAPEAGIRPDQAVRFDPQTGYESLFLGESFKPFGEAPRFDSAFYLAAEDAFGRADARIQVDFTLTGRGDSPASLPSPELILKWEFFDGEEWTELGTSTPYGVHSTRPDFYFYDSTQGFYWSGTVGFERPATWTANSVRNLRAHWLRCRIHAGDYGKPETLVLGPDGIDWRASQPVSPPEISKLSIRYSGVLEKPQLLRGERDFAFYAPEEILAERSRFAMFPRPELEPPLFFLGLNTMPPPGEFCLAFELDEPKHGQGNPAGHASWEYWNGRRWADLRPLDLTGGLSRSELLSFRTPPDWESREAFGKAGHWLRARFASGADGSLPHARVRHIRLNAAPACEGNSILSERLGRSSGRARQSFRLSNGPLTGELQLAVEEPARLLEHERAALTSIFGSEAVWQDNGVQWARWIEVPHFADSTSRDRHFTVDRVDGRVCFGDGRRGLVPHKSSEIVVLSYRVGGGERGNTPAGSLNVLRESVPYVEAVHNPAPARGGADLQPLNEILVQGPQLLRNRNRAMAVEDYQVLVERAFPEVARALCVTEPLEDGVVKLFLVPVPDSGDEAPGGPPRPSPELRVAVEGFLRSICCPTAKVVVGAPRCVPISVRLAFVPRKAGAQSERLKLKLEERVRRFLDPVQGGHDGAGWPWGRGLAAAELNQVLRDLADVERLTDIELVDVARRRTVDRRDLGERELFELISVEAREEHPRR